MVELGLNKLNINMIMQALEYENQGYSAKLLDEFWDNARKYLIGSSLEPVFKELEQRLNH